MGQGGTKSLPQYRAEDVALHQKRGDLWLIIHGKVYDVSTFLNQHPGNPQVLLDVAGQDASAEFDAATHSPEAFEQMQQFLIGEVVTSNDNIVASPSLATSPPSQPKQETPLNSRRVLVLYASQRGTATGLAYRIAQFINSLAIPGLPRLVSDIRAMNDFEPEDLDKESLVLFVISTHTEGSAPLNGQLMCKWLADASKDFRVSKTHFGQMNYSIFGLGDTNYEEQFNATAKKVQGWVSRLGGKLLCTPGAGNNNAARADSKTIEDDLAFWLANSLGPALASPKLYSSEVIFRSHVIHILILFDA
jgi:sulfite reductase alpha subunit-like flavoprotein